MYAYGHMTCNWAYISHELYNTYSNRSHAVLFTTVVINLHKFLSCISQNINLHICNKYSMCSPLSLYFVNSIAINFGSHDRSIRVFSMHTLNFSANTDPLYSQKALRAPIFEDFNLALKIIFVKSKTGIASLLYNSLNS